MKCIDFTTKPGDLVFDPFVGNGTTAVVSKSSYRHYFGFEINNKMKHIININLKQDITGLIKFPEDSYFFKGHFPELPIVPGVILIEALAQTAGIVVAKTFEKEEDKSVLFMSISDAKFRKPVLPNDKIIFEVSFINSVKNVYKFFGIASKGTNSLF